jgi:hypothetical protein
MAKTHQVAILFPLLVGTATTAITIVIHALALGALIRFIRRERRLGRAGSGFLRDVTIVAVVVLIGLAAHLIEISVWALVLEICGEFSETGRALYESAMNYTTLGYGDLIMSSRWKLLGPLEAADGVLMFGVSTAMIFAVIQGLVMTRYRDLR